jgi:CubicO group peptidase (beta-lactamase class C family)
MVFAAPILPWPLMMVEEGLIARRPGVALHSRARASAWRWASPAYPASAAATGHCGHGPKPDADYIPASRDITVRDLLTHTADFDRGPARRSAGDIPRKPTDKLADIVRCLERLR